jgi:hypothetical protein
MGLARKYQCYVEESPYYRGITLNWLFLATVKKIHFI